MVFFLSEVAGQKLPGKWQATACPAPVFRAQADLLDQMVHFETGW